jgi:hypothetical protein
MSPTWIFDQHTKEEDNPMTIHVPFPFNLFSTVLVGFFFLHFPIRLKFPMVLPDFRSTQIPTICQGPSKAHTRQV